MAATPFPPPHPPPHPPPPNDQQSLLQQNNLPPPALPPNNQQPPSQTMNTPPEQHQSLNMYSNTSSNNASGANSQQHSRPGSGRRSVSSSQPLSGQLPSASNGSTTAGSTPVPLQHQQPHGQPPGISIGPNMPPFDASRSPPSNKNLNHVPCKFYRQGACQAGKACPFSHNLDAATDSAPCKYFSKGNCKFGIKCALAHVLPDGRKINRPNYNNGGHGQIQFSRMDTSHTNHRSALHNSLLQANMLPHHTPNSFNGQDDFSGLPSHQSSNGDSIPNSLPGDPQLSSDNLPISSSQRTLGPLDATLPASFERHDFSLFARTGPYASSVPSKFGMESPPPSLPNGRPGVLQSLYQSAFGEEENGGLGGGLSRSPRVNEDSLGHRMMYSSAPRRPKLSSSYARAENMERILGDRLHKDSSLDGDFAFEEDFVPSSLNELLTPAERNRRLSRTDEEAVSNFRHSLTAPGTPADPGVIGSPPVGSPGAAGGWGPIVMRTKRDEDYPPTSSVGHVGSPLRNSYHHGDTSPTFRSLGRPPSGEISPFPGSPTRTNSGISALTQTLQRARLSTSRSEPYGPGEFPTLSKTLCPSGKQMGGTISSSHSSNGKVVMSIDEEPETQFLMEDEEEAPSRPMIGFGVGVGSTGRGSGLGLEVSQRDWEGFGSRR